MKVFHKDFINVLPDDYLLIQWQDLIKILTAIEKGRALSPSVKVLDFPAEQFARYVHLVERELELRKLTFDKYDFQNKIITLTEKFNNNHTTKSLYDGWHNNRYYAQNYYALQEDYDCNLIKEEDWDKITDKYYRLYNANGDSY